MALVMWGEGYYVAACIFICRCGEEWRRGEIGWEMGGDNVHDEMMNSGMCVLGFGLSMGNVQLDCMSPWCTAEK